MEEKMDARLRDCRPRVAVEREKVPDPVLPLLSWSVKVVDTSWSMAKTSMLNVAIDERSTAVAAPEFR